MVLGNTKESHHTRGSKLARKGRETKMRGSRVLVNIVIQNPKQSVYDIIDHLQDLGYVDKEGKPVE